MASSLHTCQPCRVAMFSSDREGEEGLAQVFAASSSLILSGHGKPVIHDYACHISTLWVELIFDRLFGWGLSYSFFYFPFGLKITNLGFKC